MSRRGKAGAYKRRDPHTWTQVHRHMRCGLSGGHEVEAGAWVRSRAGVAFVSCEDCLRKAGIHRPARSFSLTRDDGADVKSRQSGGDE